MEVFVGLMFVTVVGLAVLLSPNLGELAAGVVPWAPSGSLLFILSLIGGVGASLLQLLGARARLARILLDPDDAYGLTRRLRGDRRFMVAMLVVGAELLFANNEGISGEEGLGALADPIQERFGVVAGWLFLLGFRSAAVSSVVGAWNGSAYLLDGLLSSPYV